MGKEQCPLCVEKFSNHGTLKNHIKWKHEREPRLHQCNKCGKVFSYKSKLIKHERSHNKNETIKYPCPLCNYVSLDIKDILLHYSDPHNLDLSPQIIHFKTWSEFCNWKQNISIETKAMFSNRNGSWGLKDGAKVFQFWCHRSGFYKSSGSNIRRVKEIGSNKINSLCPACIKAKLEPDGTIEVSFVNTHVGHEMDVRRLILTKNDRDNIAEKLSEKRSYKSILEELQESKNKESLKKIHFLTKKDLTNIKRAYGLGPIKKHSSFKLSSWVTSLNNTSVVRFFKPQGRILDSFPQIKKTDFYLVLMNDLQLFLLKELGNNCLYIDNIAGKSGKDFQLFTIMAFDQDGDAYPCSYFVSNRGDTIALKVFFETIKDCLGSSIITPKLFLSDVDDTYYNTWCSVMGQEFSHRIYCSWHVDRKWKINLANLKNKKKCSSIHIELRSLMLECDMDKFHAHLGNFINYICSDDDMNNFIVYFERFRSMPSLWAYAYRSKVMINSNKSAELIRRELQDIYLKDRPDMRFDNIWYDLMIFSSRTVGKYIYKLDGEQLNPEIISSIIMEHSESVSIPFNDISMHDEFWIVPASEKNFYVSIKKYNECCCSFICKECNNCIHNFICSCLQSLVEWKMCKHIHALSQFLSGKASNHMTVEICNDSVDGISEKVFDGVIQAEDSISFDCVDIDVINSNRFEASPESSVEANDSQLVEYFDGYVPVLTVPSVFSNSQSEDMQNDNYFEIL